MSLRKVFFKGISWVAILRGSTRGIAIIKIALIARILSPEQVGIYGLAFLVISLLEVLTETGVNVFLIQEKKKLEEYVSTAWIVSILRGAIISLIIVLSANTVSNFFNSPELYSLLMLIALVPLLRGFINPSIVKFQKEMNFRSDFNFRFIIFLVDAVAAIVITYYLNSPIGMIWGLIVGVLVELILSHLFISPKPRLTLDLKKVSLIISRGKWVTGTGIFQYAFREGDDVFVGRFLGADSLGIYQTAYKFATLPISEVADVFSKVALPLFVNISADRRKLKSLYIKSTLGILALVIPFAILLFIFAEEIVLLLLGSNWLATAPVLQILVIYSILRASIEPAMSVFLALKKQEYTTIISLFSLTVLFIMVWPLSASYGLIGVGLATIVATISSIPLVIFFVSKAFRND